LEELIVFGILNLVMDLLLENAFADVTFPQGYLIGRNTGLESLYLGGKNIAEDILLILLD